MLSLLGPICLTATPTTPLTSSLVGQVNAARCLLVRRAISHAKSASPFPAPWHWLAPWSVPTRALAVRIISRAHENIHIFCLPGVRACHKADRRQATVGTEPTPLWRVDTIHCLRARAIFLRYRTCVFASTPPDRAKTSRVLSNRPIGLNSQSGRYASGRQTQEVPYRTYSIVGSRDSWSNVLVVIRSLRFPIYPYNCWLQLAVGAKGARRGGVKTSR